MSWIGRERLRRCRCVRKSFPLQTGMLELARTRAARYRQLCPPDVYGWRNCGSGRPRCEPPVTSSIFAIGVHQCSMSKHLWREAMAYDFLPARCMSGSNRPGKNPKALKITRSLRPQTLFSSFSVSSMCQCFRLEVPQSLARTTGRSGFRVELKRN